MSAPFPPLTSKKPRFTNPGIPLQNDYRGGESDTVREIPPEWRAALDLEVIEQSVPLDFPIFELTDEILASKIEQQFTSEKKIRTTRKPPGVFVLQERFTDKNKEFGTRTRFFGFEDLFDIVPGPTALRDINTRNFGNKHFETVIEEIPGLFVADSYLRSRPIVTPEDFRAKLEETEHGFNEDGIASLPNSPLPPGVISHGDVQSDVFTHRETVKQIDLLDLPEFIVNVETNRAKQQVGVVRKLDLDSVLPPLPTATSDVEFTVLGDGTALTVQRNVDEVFDELTTSSEIADLVPEIFRAALPVQTIEFVQEGTTIDDPPPLGPGAFYIREKRETEYTRRITVRGRFGLDLPRNVTILRHTGPKEFGGGITKLNGLLDDSEPLVEAGLEVVNSEVRDLGNGMWFRQTELLDGDLFLEWPTLVSKLWDKETQSYAVRETQIVEPDYEPFLGTFIVEDVEAIDDQHSRRIRTTRDFSAHNSKETAITSTRFHPFPFPGTLDYNRLITYSHREGYRRASALLCKHKIRTWWIDSPTEPTSGDQDLGTFDVDVKEIITDTVNVPIYTSGSNTEAQTFPEVLHDDITNTLGANYPATTPSFTEYYLGTSSGTPGTGSIYTIMSPGTGYAVGDLVTICGTPCAVLSVGVSNSILAINQAAAPPTGVIITGLTDAGPCSVSGGSGTGAAFNELVVTYETVIPGTAWVGSEKTIAGAIDPTEVPNLWKVVTESVVMR